MKATEAIDKKSITTQYIIDEQGNKTAVILSLNQFNELVENVTLLTKQVEELQAKATSATQTNTTLPEGIDNDKYLVSTQINLLQQHYDVLNRLMENVQGYDDLDTALARKLQMQRLIKLIDTEHQSIRQQLTQLKQHTKSATLYHVPPLPPYLKENDSLFNEIKTRLLARAVNKVKPPVVIHAPSGTGKSVFAVLLAQDPKIQENFPDGIFWLTLGKDPDLLANQITLIHLLDEHTTNVFDVEEGTNRLRELCATRACLFILDDVTDAQDVLAFNIGGDYCQLLITSTENNLADILQYFINSTKGYELRSLNEEQAIQLFWQYMGEEANHTTEVPIDIAEIVRFGAYLPLAIKLTANLARTQSPTTWETLLNDLQDQTTAFPDKYPHTLMQAFQLNVDALGEPADYYLALAVFIDYAHIPYSVVVMLWRYLYQLRDEQAHDFINELAEKGLLHLDETTSAKYIRLHSFQHDYLCEQAELEKLHNHLLAAYRRQCNQHGWLNGPNDGYFFEYLGMHLNHAKRLNELRPLLLDYDWLNNKLQATNIHALLSDFEWLDDKDTNIIKDTLYEAAIVLHTNKAELANQLLDRLWGQKTLKNNKDIQALLNQAKEASPNWRWQPHFPDELKEN